MIPVRTDLLRWRASPILFQVYHLLPRKLLPCTPLIIIASTTTGDIKQPGFSHPPVLLELPAKDSHCLGPLRGLALNG